MEPSTLWTLAALASKTEGGFAKLHVETGLLVGVQLSLFSAALMWRRKGKGIDIFGIFVLETAHLIVIRFKNFVNSATMWSSWVLMFFSAFLVTRK